MAERNLDIVINAKNNADKELKSLGKSLEAHKATIQKVTAVSAAAFAGLTAAIGASVKSYANAGDQVQKMAQRIGFSTTALSELKHVAELSGTSLEAIEKASLKMGKTLLDASDESMMAQRAIERLGVSLEDLGRMSPEERFFTLASAVGDVQDPTRRAAMAMEIFGKSGTQLLPMLDAGAEGIAAMRAEAHDLGIVFDEDAANAAAHFNDNMLRLGRSMDGVKFAIAEAFIPVLTELLEKVAPVIQRVKDWIKENPTLTRNIILVVAALTGFVAVMGTLTLLLMAFNPVSVAIIAGIGLFATVSYGTVKALEFLSEKWKSIWGGIKSVTYTTINGIIAMVEWYVNTYVSAINTVIRAINRVIAKASAIPGIGKRFAGLEITEMQKVEFGRVGQEEAKTVNVTVFGDVSGQELLRKVGTGLMGELSHNVRI